MEIEEVIRKIRKLLTLSRDPGATPEESASAADKAAQLLAEHRIAMSEIPREETEAKGPEIVSGVSSPISAKRLIKWIDRLAVAVGKATGTKVINSLRPEGRCFIYMGTPVAVETAKHMLDFLKAEVFSLHAERASVLRGKSESDSYKKGVATTIYHRIVAAAEARKQEPVYGALMVLNDKALDAYVKEKYPELRKGTKNVAKDVTALRMGLRDGHRASLGGDRLSKASPAGYLD